MRHLYITVLYMILKGDTAAPWAKRHDFTDMQMKLRYHCNNAQNSYTIRDNWPAIFREWSSYLQVVTELHYHVHYRRRAVVCLNS